MGKRAGFHREWQSEVIDGAIQFANWLEGSASAIRGCMETILVTETSSAFGKRSLHNQVAWQLVKGERLILAVGAPTEWKSSKPLPPTAVVTDLVAASVEDLPLARQLWGAFLGHLIAPQLPGWHFALPRFMRPAVPVAVKLASGAALSAVCSAIQSSRGPLRFKV